MIQAGVLARVALLAGLILLAAPTLARAWGEQGHRAINASAIDHLPEPLRAYFRARQAYFLDHAVDPDILGRSDPEERLHHFAEVEAYDKYSFHAFRQYFVAEHGAPTPLQLSHGDAVWQIERLTLEMAEALRRGRWDAADHAALFLAHYAGDLTQPLHTVLNYDGQLTHQTGIHARFETDLVRYVLDHYTLQAAPPVAEPDLRARIFREMLNSYSYRNPLFAADRIAVEGRSYSDPQYFWAFSNLVGLLARKRLEAAISFVSSVWYTGWVRAGKPDLKSGTRYGERARSSSLPHALSDNPLTLISLRGFDARRSSRGAETHPSGGGNGCRSRRPERAGGIPPRPAPRGGPFPPERSRQRRLPGYS